MEPFNIWRERIEARLVRLKPPTSINFSRIISWDPNGGADVQTWDELMGLLRIAPSPMSVYIESDAVVPPGIWEMQGSFFFGRFNQSVTLTVSDGAVLRNVHEISDNLNLRSVSSAPILEFDFFPGQQVVFLMLFGARMTNDGTAQIVAPPDGTQFVLAMFVAGGLFNPTPGLGTVLVGNGSQFIMLSQGANQPLGNFGDFAQSPALSFMGYAGFAGPYPTPAGFLGSIVNIAVDLNGGSGPTAFRPVAGIAGLISLGTSYFDTGIVPPRPIWWNGVGWIDATGAPA